MSMRAEQIIAHAMNEWDCCGTVTQSAAIVAALEAAGVDVRHKYEEATENVNYPDQEPVIAAVVHEETGEPLFVRRPLEEG